jgi:hypothetical protein
MKHTIRVEIVGSDAFWRNAVMVEWEYQFPERKLIAESTGYYMIEADWLDDLKRVAGRLFSKVLMAPANPSRRQYFRWLFPHTERR